jgi:hypothetical protein
MSISYSDLMPIRTKRSDAGLSQCETLIGIRQHLCSSTPPITRCFLAKWKSPVGRLEFGQKTLRRPPPTRDPSFHAHLSSCASTHPATRSGALPTRVGLGCCRPPSDRRFARATEPRLRHRRNSKAPQLPSIQFRRSSRLAASAKVSLLAPSTGTKTEAPALRASPDCESESWRRRNRGISSRRRGGPAALTGRNFSAGRDRRDGCGRRSRPGCSRVFSARPVAGSGLGASAAGAGRCGNNASSICWWPQSSAAAN